MGCVSSSIAPDYAPVAKTKTQNSIIVKKKKKKGCKADHGPIEMILTTSDTDKTLKPGQIKITIVKEVPISEVEEDLSLKRKIQKGARTVTGTALIAIGIPLIPTPVPGIVFIAGGLSVLSTEYPEAAVIMEKGRDKLAKYAEIDTGSSMDTGGSIVDKEKNEAKDRQPSNNRVTIADKNNAILKSMNGSQTRVERARSWGKEVLSSKTAQDANKKAKTVVKKVFPLVDAIVAERDTPQEEEHIIQIGKGNSKKKFF